MMRKAIYIRQRDMADCAAACLASVAAYYRLMIPVSRIRQYAGTDRQGTNMTGIVEAAERLGFRAKGVKGGSDSLGQVPLPAIAHVIQENGLRHFVVIYRVGRRKIRLMDPAYGAMRRMDRKIFSGIWSGMLVLLMPGENFKSLNERQTASFRFWQLARPHSSIIIQAAVGALVYTILGLSVSIYLQKIVDHVLTEGNVRLLNLLGLTMTGIVIFQLIIGQVKSLLVLRTGQHIDAGLILGYYAHLLQLPQRFFDTMRVGEILSRINDAVKIRVFINDAVINMLVNGFIVLCSIGLMFMYYWKLALIMMLILPFYIIVYLTGNRIHKKWQRKLMENYAGLETQLIESLNSVRTLKSFDLALYMLQLTERKFVQLLRTIYRTGIFEVHLGGASEFVTRIFTVIMLWAGSYFVTARELSPGELLSFYALIGYFTGPAMYLAGASRHVQDALVAADRLFEILDLETEEADSGQAEVRELDGDIELKGVHFRHGTRTVVFRGLDMKLKKGTSTAIVGESGSGKSTLVSLLQRLYPVQEGTIMMGANNINHIAIRSLRRLVGVVPQQIDLFAGTILENIAVGEPDPDLQKVAGLAEILGIREFIEALPGHYFTSLEENGINLSGGQRQRLAIARALYREPEILILDEATASLDANSEDFVRQALSWYRNKGKTIIVIAHRLRTVRDCNRIVVLRNGQVAEQGTHEELMAEKSVYKEMFDQGV